MECHQWISIICCTLIVLTTNYLGEAGRLSVWAVPEEKRATTPFSLYGGNSSPRTFAPIQARYHIVSHLRTVCGGRSCPGSRFLWHYPKNQIDRTLEGYSGSTTMMINEDVLGSPDFEIAGPFYSIFRNTASKSDDYIQSLFDLTRSGKEIIDAVTEVNRQSQTERTEESSADEESWVNGEIEDDDENVAASPLDISGSLSSPESGFSWNSQQSDIERKKETTEAETAFSHLKHTLRSSISFCLLHRTLASLDRVSRENIHTSIARFNKETGLLQVVNYGRGGLAVFDARNLNVKLSMHSEMRLRRSRPSRASYLSRIDERSASLAGLHLLPETKVDQIHLKHHDVIVLASRGVWRFISDQDILNIMAGLNVGMTDLWSNILDFEEYAEVLNEKITEMVHVKQYKAGDTETSIKIMVSLVSRQ